MLFPAFKILNNLKEKNWWVNILLMHKPQIRQSSMLLEAVLHGKDYR